MTHTNALLPLAFVLTASLGTFSYAVPPAPGPASAATTPAVVPAATPAVVPATLSAGAPLGLTPAASIESSSSSRSVDGQLNAFDRTRPFPVADKRAYFTNIKDGDKLKSPFRVAFSVSGMGVAPVSAGKIDGTGHHHILINRSFPLDIKAPIPFDKPGEVVNQQYKHFGKGETETVLELPPGKHTLQLLFADHQHVPYYIKSGVLNIEVVK